jgi:PAS domain S-box-containing protein
MFKVYINKRILAGFLIAIGVLAWLAIYAFNNTREMISSSRWVAHTNEVLYNAERILVVCVNIEIGQRGYALTGNSQFLEPYLEAKNEIYERQRSLGALTSDNTIQQARLTKLAGNIDTLLAFSSSAISARKKSFEVAQNMNASLNGKNALDKIRALIHDIEIEEKTLLTQRVVESEQNITEFNVGFLSLVSVTIVVLVLIFYATNSNIQQRIQSQAQLQKVSEEIRDLYNNAPWGYHSLNEQGHFVEINNTLLRWLGYQHANEVIGKSFIDIIPVDQKPKFEENYTVFRRDGVINDLEFILKRKNGSTFPVILSSTAIADSQGNYIKSRSNTFDNTARKEAENKMRESQHELEAFAYSVSHDLRAPLRSIDGYARVLVEDYAAVLDTEGKRVIDVIMNNTIRMNQLINDLLDFARVGKKDITLAPVDMTNMVQSVVSELVQQANGRNIDVVIHPLSKVAVDLEMMRQVWTNLISNAIKYTGKTTEPRIEILSYNNGAEVTYQVKDNGVGFDMQYADKLFGVFQRLHKMQDFNGTGVGLAIVKRIVARHQGRVWAEGKIDNGAIFYFTIPHVNGNQ